MRGNPADKPSSSSFAERGVPLQLQGLGISVSLGSSVRFSRYGFQVSGFGLGLMT